MAKCLQCGLALPSAGVCPRCYGKEQGPKPVAAGILEKELKLDRRRVPLGESEMPTDRAPRPPAAAVKPKAKKEPVLLGGSDGDGPEFLDSGEVVALSDDVPPGTLNHVSATPASVWRRLAAFAVDASILSGLAALYLVVGAAVVGKKGSHPMVGLDGLVLQAHAVEPLLVPGAALLGVLAFAYAVSFAVFLQGRTPGRLVVGIRLVDRTGLPPTPVRAVIRAALALVSFAVFLGGFWLALFDRKGQTLHDKLTSTFVVRPGSFAR